MKTQKYAQMNISQIVKETPKEALNVLYELMKKYTKISTKGFSIDITLDTSRWHQAIQTIGIYQSYRLMGAFLNELYKEKFTEDFLFSDECMAFEIEYHANAYFNANGYPGYTPHITTYIMSKEFINTHCDKIDISLVDLFNNKQRLMFNYDDGIRACYKGSEKDPYRNER